MSTNKKKFFMLTLESVVRGAVIGVTLYLLIKNGVL